MDRVTDGKKRIAALDAALHPIANRPEIITALKRLIISRKFPHALDEAEVINFYSGCNDAKREAICELFVEHKSFLWAAALSHPPIIE